MITSVVRPSSSSLPAFLRLLAFAWPLKGWLALSALIGLATVASGVGLMATSAYLISEAALHPSVAALGVSMVGVRFFSISRGIFRYLERYVSHYVALSITARIRVWFYSAVEPLAPARLIKYRGGDLLSRAVADIETLQDFYVRTIYPPLVAILVAILLWLLLGAFNPLFALIFTICYLAAGVGVPILVHLLGRRLGSEIVKVRADLSAHLADSIRGLAEVVAFGQAQQRAEQADTLNRRLVLLQSRMSWVSGLEAMLGSLLMSLASWLMLVAAIPLVYDGQLDGVYLATILLAALAGFEGVLPLPGAARNLGGGLEAAGRLFEIADEQPAVHDPAAGTPSPTPTHHNVTFTGVTFRYEGNTSTALDNVSLAIPEGECLAIAGPSGAGKSTVANLLLRLWDYTEGEIKLDGHDLRLFKGDDVRALMAVVSQHTYLFNTTIRGNLLIARPNASNEEVMDALKRAQLYSFVQSLPAGLDTPVGEDGIKLSGGERQRLAIARAFLKDAPILILDEPTAHLDAATELALLTSLKDLSLKRTTLLITHSLRCLEIADKVVVMRNGRIVRD